MYTAPANASFAGENETFGQQQRKTVSGTVVDVNGEPVTGANVVEKGVAVNGTITNIDGQFSLDVSQEATLTVSYIGYVTQEIAVTNRTNLNVTLVEDAKVLEEVVVVGYGTQKKMTLTGSVSAISNQDLIKAPVSNISKAIVGRLPGVRVVDRGGNPGSDATVDIRGFGSPLILVDGIEQSGFQIDPNEIESISVLKDASAAIYGVKAGNGVMLVTTKKGVTGKAKITYNASYGWQNFSSFPEMINALDYAESMNEDALNRGIASVYTREDLEKFRVGTEEGYRSYDWYDVITRPNAPQTQHNLNVSGGNEAVNYFTSVGYLNQDGQYRSNLRFERYNIRSNISARIARYLTAEVQLSGRIENRNTPRVSVGNVVQVLPIFSPWANDDNHDYFQRTTFGTNNAINLYPEQTGYDKQRYKLFNGQFSLKYDVPFVEGLSAKLLFSYLGNLKETKNFSKEYYLYSYDRAVDSYNRTYTGNSPSALTRRDDIGEQNFLQFRLDYNRIFAQKHTVSAFLAYEQREDLSDFVSAYRQFDIDALDQINAGRDLNKTNEGTQSEGANVSFIGRLNYDYLSKYMVNLTFREDGSAKFYKNNRWGFFPGAEVAWRISEESFLKDRYAADLSNLKLRLSYGKMGDDRVAAFQYLTGYNYPGSTSYILGSNVVRGLVSKGLANENFTWFTSEIYNAGLDASFRNGLLEASLDVFYRQRNGLLAYRTESLPNTFGATLPQENLNSDDYRGFELTLGHNYQVGDFRYSVKGNMSLTRSKNRYIEQNDPINSFLYWRNNRSDRWNNIEYGYVCVGQFQNQDDINRWAVQDGSGNTTLLPGDLKFEDFNGDGVINDLDVQPIGRSNTPEIYYGFDITANWKGFDFSVLIQGATHYARYMRDAAAYPLFNSGTSLKSLMDRWHRADPFDPESEWIPGKYPSTYATGKTNNTRASTFYNLDSYYLRIKNIELGYTFPKQWIHKTGLNNLRLYVSGNNVLTFDNLPYGDPEAASGTGFGYPSVKIWNVGINVTF
jgi:TonB-linked SusC/RagA family outer membrane protein